MNKKTKEKWHFIGIGGIGMSGLAKLLVEDGCEVSGSDKTSNVLIQKLQEHGSSIFLGHHETHIKKGFNVVYSTDIAKINPELSQAREYNCPLFHRSDLLHNLSQAYESLFVAGTHGKTTTSSLLAHVLTQASLSPSFAVGGIIKSLGTNARKGEGKIFVAEADESDGTFTKYFPFGAIITNIGDDHLNHYGSKKEIEKAFIHFVKNIRSSEHLFWCKDDPILNSLSLQGVSYGFSRSADAYLHHFQQKGWEISFDLTFNGRTFKEIKAPMIGKHNALNAASVFLMAEKLGVDEEMIRKGLLSFLGVVRRSEKLIEKRSVAIVDDYAHHPSEIMATLAALRKAFPWNRLVAVFQPHRYSRVKDNMEKFPRSFHKADLVILTDIYEASETPIPGVTNENLFTSFQKELLAPLHYFSKDILVDSIFSLLRPHDVIVFLGAGDSTQLARKLAEKLENETIHPYKVALFFGGRSIEHPISIVSARFVYQALSKEKYEVFCFGIDRKGNWGEGKDLLQEKGLSFEKNTKMISQDLFTRFLHTDVCIPVFHGPYGEDGTIQGFFEIMNKPYIGFDVSSASSSMNKITTKKLAVMENIPTLPFLEILEHSWENAKEKVIEEILEKFQFPIFIKPAHLGSSLGISKVTKRESLEEIIDQTFAYDDLLYAEQGIVGRELEFSILGDIERMYVFFPGEVLTGGRIYDFKAKYDKDGFKTTTTPELSEKILQEGMKFSKAMYKALGGSGLARIDFLLDQSENLFLSEVNPFPGMTETSLYPKSAKDGGFIPEVLLDTLLQQAFFRKRNQEKRLAFQKKVEL